MAQRSLTRRQFCGSLLAAVPLVQSTTDLAVATATAPTHGEPESHKASFHAVRRPCSLRKICRALSAQFRTGVELAPELDELRVIWAFGTEPSLEEILARLAELTDSRVVKVSGSSGKERYRLERRPGTPGREEAWRTAALTRTLHELLRAVDQHEHGTLDPSAFSKNIQFYLQYGRAPQLKFLRLLTPEQTVRLLHGELIRFTTDQVSHGEIEQIVKERYSVAGRGDEPAEDLQRYQDEELERIRQYGLGLQIDFNRKNGPFSLMLQIGNRGGNVLAGFGDEELGLPLTRANPYRWLEAGAQALALPELPPAFSRRLEEEVTVPVDGGWGAAVGAMARATRIDLLADGYLCRLPSRLSGAAGQKTLLVGKGVTVAEALDLFCRQHQYLWWEKDECAYLRARAWVWDVLYEPSDRFLDQWEAALARGSAGPKEFAELSSLSPLQLNGLGNLGGTSSTGQFSPDNEAIRQLLRLFRQCSPAQQFQLLGAGLVVSPDQANRFDLLLRPTRADTPPAPLLLQVKQHVKIDLAFSPPLLKAEMRLVRDWQPSASQQEFAVEIPQGAGQLNPLEIVSNQPIRKGEDAHPSNQ